MKKRLLTIECPRCGRKYLPAEIYYPDKFLGKPRDIDKFADGRIDTFNGETVNPEETFECEKCGTVFRSYAVIRFETKILDKKDYNYDYKIKINKPALFLDED